MCSSMIPCINCRAAEQASVARLTRMETSITYGDICATIKAIVSYYVAFSTTVLIAGHYCTNYEHI